MTEPTMNKEDIKLEYDNIGQLNWDQIKTVCGRAAPQTARALFDEVRKKLKDKSAKKPYAKVGLVKGSMYLRFKDGSTHLGDVLLVKGWQPPAAAAAADPATAKKVSDFIAERKELQAAVLAGKRALKTYHDQLVGVKAEVDALAARAQATKTQGLPVDEGLIPAAQKMIGAAGKLLKAGHELFDKNVHPIFDKHRTVTKPAGVDDKDVEGWGKVFFLTVGTDYTKAFEYLRLIDSTFEQIAAAKESLDRWIIGAEDAILLHERAARATQAQVRTELTDLRNALMGTKAIDNLARNLNEVDVPKVLKAFKDGDDKIAMASADTATVKITKAGQNYKLMKKHFDKLMQLSGEPVRSIPKELLKHPRIAPCLEAIGEDVKAAKAYDRDQLALLEAGMKAYQVLKKLVSAKGQGKL